jgi:cytochrome c
MKRVVCGVMFFAVMFFVGAVYAATLEEAKALGEKAAVYVKANGKEKGVSEIANPKGQFVKGELYVTSNDFSGVVLANPMNSGLVGQNHMSLKDPNGKLFVKEMVEIAKTKGGGWLEYSWVNPATKKVQAKKAWVQRVEGMEVLTMSGLFQ